MPTINDLEIDDYLHRCVTLDRTILVDEFTQVSADFAYWSHQYAVSHRDYLRSKMLRTQARAMAYAQARDLLMANRGKASIPEIDAAVELNEKVMESEASVIECEYNRARLKGCVEAVRSKREMLITLGAHIREEMKGDPRINERAWKRDTKDDADWGDEGEDDQDS